jgi:hypothetical protein
MGTSHGAPPPPHLMPEYEGVVRTSCRPGALVRPVPLSSPPAAAGLSTDLYPEEVWLGSTVTLFSMSAGLALFAT